MIDDAREKGATPVLVSLTTPTNAGGKWERRNDSYGKCNREVVAQTGSTSSMPTTSLPTISTSTTKDRPTLPKISTATTPTPR
jgi:hypothetical protein